MKPTVKLNRPTASCSARRLGLSVTLAGLLLLTPLVFLEVSSQADGPSIHAIGPSQGPNNFDATMVITGTDFQVAVSGTTVLTAPIVHLDDEELPCDGLPTSRTLTVVVPWGLDEGVYAISVENADGSSATLTEAFTVTPALGVWSIGGTLRRLGLRAGDGRVCHLYAVREPTVAGHLQERGRR